MQSTGTGVPRSAPFPSITGRVAGTHGSKPAHAGVEPWERLRQIGRNPMRVRFLLLPLLLSMRMTVAEPAPDEDPFLWLENVEGERALKWVEGQNATTRA